MMFLVAPPLPNVRNRYAELAPPAMRAIQPQPSVCTKSAHALSVVMLAGGFSALIAIYPTAANVPDVPSAAIVPLAITSLYPSQVPSAYLITIHPSIVVFSTTACSRYSCKMLLSNVNPPPRTKFRRFRRPGWSFHPAGYSAFLAAFQTVPQGFHRLRYSPVQPLL